MTWWMLKTVNRLIIGILTNELVLKNGHAKKMVSFCTCLPRKSMVPISFSRKNTFLLSVQTGSEVYVYIT